MVTRNISLTLVPTVYTLPSALKDFDDGMLSQTWLQFWILSINSFSKIHKVPEAGSASVSRWNREREEPTLLAIQKKSWF